MIQALWMTHLQAFLDADFELDSQIDEEEDSELDIPANGFTFEPFMAKHDGATWMLTRSASSPLFKFRV